MGCGDSSVSDDIVDRLFDSQDKDAIWDAVEEINNLRNDVEMLKNKNEELMDEVEKLKSSLKLYLQAFNKAAERLTEARLGNN